MVSFEPIDIDLGNDRSVSIVYSGGKAKYRYDIYENNMIVGALGIDVIIENVEDLNDIVSKYIKECGKF